MAPDQIRRNPRQEFEHAFLGKELGRSRRQRVRRLAPDVPESSSTAASHGDDPKLETIVPPPREDRAG